MIENLINYPCPAIKIGGLGYVSADEKTIQLYLALISPVFNHKIELQKMELINPSQSDLEPIIDYKIGIDFMTNQPIYKFKKMSNAEAIATLFLNECEKEDSLLRIIEDE